MPGNSSPIGSVTRGTTGHNRLRRVDRWIASLPAFRRTAERIAWAWAAAFMVIVVADLAMMYVPAFTATAGTVVILAALAAAAWFTAWLPKAAKR